MQSNGVIPSIAKANRKKNHYFKVSTCWDASVTPNLGAIFFSVLEKAFSKTLHFFRKLYGNNFVTGKLENTMETMTGIFF